MKKTIAQFLTLITLLFLVPGLSSCEYVSSIVSEINNSGNNQAHQHKFTLKDTDDTYLKSEATCTSSAFYYYSCECGAKGTEFFKKGSPLKHDWSEATCESPKTCSRCLETEGEALTHAYIDGKCVFCGASNSQSGNNEHVHQYDQKNTNTSFLSSAATCTDSAKYFYSCKCSDVGNNTFDYGKASGHNWVDATCTSPKSCSVCKVTDGEKLPHNFTDGICSECEENDPDYKAYSEGLAYTLSTNGTYYSVTGIGTCTDTNIVIPDTYEGLPVINIDAYAFQNCKAITSVTISENVTRIGRSAFYGCSSLKNVYITDIAAWCNISFGDNASNPLFYAHRLYLNGELITDLVIPEGVTTIPSYAFYCNITSATIPDSVLSIGEYAFGGDSIQKENGVSYVDRWVVDCDTSVETVVLRENTVGIASVAFFNCTSLANITIPDNVTIIDTSAFDRCFSLTNVTIPDSVIRIGHFAFYECSALTSVTIGNGVTSIGMGAFYHCFDLININIPNSVTQIDIRAFDGCSSLESINIPNSVIVISSGAFKNCSNLTIYCEAESEPLGWSDIWNSSNCPVVWGAN